jgi:hypothetical protein
MLDDDDDDEAGSDEEMDADSSALSLVGSNALVADPLMGKVNPEAVQGSTDIPQATASAVVSHTDEAYDEEAGEYYDPSSDTPLTTAVEVPSDESVARRKHFGRRTQLFIAVVVLMVLAAFIIWPLVVFVGGGKNKASTYHYSSSDSNEIDTPLNNGSARHHAGSVGSGDNTQDDLFGSDDENESTSKFEDTVGRRGPLAKVIPEETLSLALGGASYACVEILQPP